MPAVYGARAEGAACQKSGAGRGIRVHMEGGMYVFMGAYG